MLAEWGSAVGKLQCFLQANTLTDLRKSHSALAQWVPQSFTQKPTNS